MLKKMQFSTKVKYIACTCQNPSAIKTEFRDGTKSYSEAFDPDDLNLTDCYPRYDKDK